MQVEKLDKRNLLIFLWVAFVAFGLIYLGISFLPIAGSIKRWTLDVVYLMPPALAAAASIVVLRRTNRTERRFWFSFMFANLFWLMGETTGIYYEIIHGLKEPPYPSFADYSYLLGYLFLFLLLMSMARFSSAFTLKKTRYLLDTFVVIIFCFVIVWFFLLKPLYLLYPDASAAEKAVNTLYPILDLGIVFGVFANLFGFKTSKWRSWEILIALGLVVTTFGDLIYNFFAASNVYGPSNQWSQVLDLSWIWSYLLFFMAAVHRLIKKEMPPRLRARTPTEDANRTWQDILIPVFVLVAISLFLYLAFNHAKSSLDYWIFATSAIILSILIVGRASVVGLENSQLFSHSVTDFTTGLFNHRFFQERMNSEMQRCQRYGQEFSIAALDIDEFGQVNNIHGHAAGDRTLREVANIIKDFARTSDTVCRTGGDEFGIVMPETDSLQAFQACQRILERIREDQGLGQISVTVSAGISSFPAHARCKEELIKKADGALYWAKYHGKDQAFIFDSNVVETLDAEERVRRAEEQSYLNTVQALAAAVDARDHYTQFHSRHVASLAVSLAQKLKLEKQRVKYIEIAAILHDVGKIGIPDKILNKKGALTESERKQIETHPELGQRILASTTVKEILPWVISHHERWDGKGYPKGLKGPDIPLEARILGVCDAYDAMISDRPYRQGLTRAAALEEIQREAGKQFDPQLVETLTHLLTQTEKLLVTTG